VPSTVASTVVTRATQTLFSAASISFSLPASATYQVTLQSIGRR